MSEMDDTDSVPSDSTINNIANIPIKGQRHSLPAKQQVMSFCR